jgi:tetratricopeptide (TPR) repeat protein
MSSPFRRISQPVAIVAALACGGAVFAQTPEAPKQLGEATSKALQQLKALEEAKNWAGIFAVLDAIPNVQPNSYDAALIASAKANTYIKAEQYAKAIEPMERALTLGDTYKYFEPRALLDFSYFLAQLYLQEGAASKDPALQNRYLTKATDYFKRWLDNSKKPTPEVMVAYASALYYRAVSDSKNVNKELLSQAEKEAEKGLLMSTVPKESFYTLLLSIYQQQNDLVRSSEILELLLKQNAQKKDYWAALMVTYLNLANENEKKDPEDYRSYLTRTIVTVERAQALGFLNTPKDCMNLVSFYMMAGQGNAATDYLYNGLKNGKIESDAKAWMNLALIYQQNNKELQAIAVLNEAAKLYPKNGQIDYLIGEIYRQIEKTREAQTYYRQAVDKGGLDKPYVVYQLLAYAAFELGEFDQALEAAKKALEFPEAKKDAQLPRLKQAIEDAIKEREYNLEQAKKKASSL